MACPTCDHTMHHIKPYLSWCPKCGTLLDNPDKEYVPQLVDNQDLDTDSSHHVVKGDSYET